MGWVARLTVHGAAMALMATVTPASVGADPARAVNVGAVGALADTPGYLRVSDVQGLLSGDGRHQVVAWSQDSSLRISAKR